MANQITFPTQFNQSVWTKQPGVVFTDAYSGFLAPDGTQTATLFQKTIQNTGEFEQKPSPQFVVNTTYTVSVWVYTAVSGSATVQFKFWSGTANTTSGFLSVIHSPAQWQRLTWTFTTPATLGSNPSMGFQSNATIGTPGASIGIWGMQLEIGSSATTFVNSFPQTATVNNIPTRARVQAVSLNGTLFGNDRNKLLYGNSIGNRKNLNIWGDTATQWTYDLSTTWADAQDWFPVSASFSYWATVLGWTNLSTGATLTAPATAPDTRPSLAIALSLAANAADGARYTFVLTALPSGVRGSYNQTGSAVVAAILTGYLARANVYVPAYAAAAASSIQFRFTDLSGFTRLSAPVSLPRTGGWVLVSDFVENTATGGATVAAGFNSAAILSMDLLVTAPASAGITATLSVEYVDLAAAFDTPLPVSGKIVSYMTSVSSTNHLLTRPVNLVPGRTYTASMYHQLKTGGATINPQFEFYAPSVQLAQFYWNISANTLGWNPGPGSGLQTVRQFANNYEVNLALNSGTGATSAEVSVPFNALAVMAANPNLATVQNADGSFNMAEAGYNVYAAYGTFGSQGNTVRLFVVDSGNRRRYSAAQTPSSGGGYYFGDTISATNNLTGTSIDAGFDPTHITAMGIVFLATGSPFTGAIEVNIINVNSTQLTQASSFLTPHPGWQRFTWTFVAPTWATPNCLFGVLLPTSVGGYFTGFQLVEDVAPANYVPYAFTQRMDAAAIPSQVAMGAVTMRATNGLIVCAPAYFKNTKPPATNYGLNLSACTSYTPEWIFLDQMKQSTGWVETKKSSDVWDPNGHFGQTIPGLPVDAQGWLTSLPGDMAVYVRMQADNNYYPLGVYTVLYDGVGNIRYDSTAIGASQCQLLSSSQVGPNTTQHLVQNNGGLTGILMKIDSCDAVNPIRNIRCIMPGFANTYATQIFHPKWLDLIKMFNSLRFMEWQQTNNSTVQNWADRASASSAFWCTSGLGVPIEMAIELCNRLIVDMWINVPPQASDDYVFQMATLIKSTLNPNLRVWLEYGNEYWNGGFQTNRNANTTGAAQGVGVAVFGAAASSFQTISAYYAKRAVQVHNIFDAVFSGAYGLLGPINPYAAVKKRRIKKVLGTQHDNPGVTDNVKIPAQFFYGANYKPDAICGGYYFPPSITWADAQNNSLINTVDDLFAAAIAKNADMFTDLSTQVAKCNAWGCDYVAYEGGANWIPTTSSTPTINANSFNVSKMANLDPRIATMYQTVMAQWQALGGKLFMFYDSVGIDKVTTLFSMLQYTSQDPLTALKYQAVLSILGPDIKFGTHTFTPQAGAPRRRRRPGLF